MTDTTQQAKEIFDYMAMQLAEGVFIAQKRKKEMIKEIKFLIETS